MKAQSEAQHKAVLAASGGSVDRRDGVEAAAAEIVMLYVGFPSLSEHTRVCGIIRKEIAERGIRPLNFNQQNISLHPVGERNKKP